MKRIMLFFAVVFTALSVNARTLIVYYSYTNTVHQIVTELKARIDADMVRIEPAEKGIDYAANNYAIGSALIGKIRENPNDASSYPAIDPVDVSLEDYDVILIGAPLWWNQMAAPLTYLFHNGSRMSGKKIGVIVSSWSSGYAGVEADAKRLIPQGDFLSPTLWLNHGDMSNLKPKVIDWLQAVDYNSLTSGIGSVDVDDAELVIKGTQLHVKGDFNSLSLFHMDGRKVMTSSEDTIDIYSVTPGLYIAHILTDAGNVSRKIIIR